MPQRRHTRTALELRELFVQLLLLGDTLDDDPVSQLGKFLPTWFTCASAVFDHSRWYRGKRAERLHGWPRSAGTAHSDQPDYIADHHSGNHNARKPEVLWAVHALAVKRNSGVCQTQRQTIQNNEKSKATA